MEASKKAIERKQEEVAKLRENADELEVKSSVSGTIASISASAGKSIGGEEQPLATINVTDRGFTVKIDVTNEQAKRSRSAIPPSWSTSGAATPSRRLTRSQIPSLRAIARLSSRSRATFRPGRISRSPSARKARITTRSFRSPACARTPTANSSMSCSRRIRRSAAVISLPASPCRSWPATISPPPFPASARAISSSRPATSPWRPASRYGLRITDEAARPV